MHLLPFVNGGAGRIRTVFRDYEPRVKPLHYRAVAKGRIELPYMAYETTVLPLNYLAMLCGYVHSTTHPLFPERHQAKAKYERVSHP